MMSYSTLRCAVFNSCRKSVIRKLKRTYSAAASESLSDDHKSNIGWMRETSQGGVKQDRLPYPVLSRPDGVLVKVKAASVNPIDVRMAAGYGRTMLGVYDTFDRVTRGDLTAVCRDSTHVQVLGRDFSGVVVDVGQSVTKFKPGDEVFGALKAIDEGTHCMYSLVTENSIASKPVNLTHIEATSIPYVALTFIAAVDPLGNYDLRNKRVFINGGAGGIGTFAIQYLKSQGCEVIVSVGEGRDIVESLNPHHILDYKSDSFQSELRSVAGFDLAFDCVGDESALSCIKPGGRFATVVSPLLPDTDELGLFAGSAKAGIGLAQKSAEVLLNHGVYYNWGFFIPNGTTLEHIRVLIENNQIKPVIDEVFAFGETHAAYEKVSKGRGRGKVVIDVSQK